MAKPNCDVRLHVLITEQQDAMLDELAEWKRRSRSDVVRLAIEAAHARAQQARQSRTLAISGTD